MKKKSELYPYVTLEKWKTPIGENYSCDLRLGSVLQTGRRVFFFLYEISKYNKETHVLSIAHGEPYRIMEEEFAWVGVNRYFQQKDPNVARKKRRRTPCSTWKLWNTDMIKELNAGDALSGYGQIKPKDIIHYVIFTGDDVIEFISPTSRWVRYRDIKVDKLIALYVKKKNSEHHEEAVKEALRKTTQQKRKTNIRPP